MDNLNTRNIFNYLAPKDFNRREILAAKCVLNCTE